MDHTSWAVLLALLYLAALTFVSRIIRSPRHRKPNLPPGPKPWPVIGNLHLIGTIPHQSLHSLSRTYGEIMLLKFGKFPVIVASSPNAAKQFLKTHDAVFASRPALSAGKLTSFNYSDMTWAPYGPHWRQARKIYMSEIFSAAQLGLSQWIRAEELGKLLGTLCSMRGRPIVLRDHLMRYTLSTTCRVVLSDKPFGDRTVAIDELRGWLDEWFFLSGAFYIGDWVPWLDSLDLQGYVKRMKDLNKKMDGFLSLFVDDCRRRGGGGKHMVDVLVEHADDPPNLDVKLTTDSVKALLQNLLVGGIDTSATTVEWAIHELLTHPHLIQKAKDELDRVIGRDRWVDENDYSRLPFIDAIIMETMRLHPLATLLVPHCALEDCKVAGYDVSQGTIVLINTWSIGRDPHAWDAVEEFYPERFLGKEVDMLGSNFALLPFGSGRRRCPGYNMGLKMVRTTLANIVHGFDMKLMEGMGREDICMEEEYGLTTHPKIPLSIIMEPTLPSHLY